jgi:two-component sensor histidine kinase/CHASE3 domain sensor protein
MQKALRVRLSSTALLMIGFFFLVLIVAMTFRLAQRTQEELAAGILARDVATAAVELRSGLLAAESSQRGFLANGNEIYLAPFSTAKTRSFRQLDTLKDLLAPDASAQKVLERLDTLVHEKFVELDQTIALKREGRNEEAMVILRSNRGKALMDEANVFLSSIVRRANDALAVNFAEQNRGLQQLSQIILFAAVCILLVVAATLWVIRGFVRSLRRAQDELTAVNAGLEKRIELRTVELTAARDRAEVLLAEVNHRVANSLTLIASMVGMQARTSTSAETRAALSETQSRISAVAVVHKKLYTSGDVETVALGEFLPSLLQQLETSMRESGHESFLKPDIAAMSLSTDKSISLGIIAAEWVTNAFKYAYPDGKGEIRVTLTQAEGGMAELRVEDDGVGRATDPVVKGTGLGTKLVSALASSLGGRVDYETGQQGTSARLSLPAA